MIFLQRRPVPGGARTDEIRLGDQLELRADRRDRALVKNSVAV